MKREDFIKAAPTVTLLSLLTMGKEEKISKAEELAKALANILQKATETTLEKYLDGDKLRMINFGQVSIPLVTLLPPTLPTKFTITVNLENNETIVLDGETRWQDPLRRETDYKTTYSFPINVETKTLEINK